MGGFFWENMRIALSELWGHKTRSILTATGIVIGIIAVSLMSTLINGVDGLFENSMKFLGRGNLYVDKWPWFGDEDWWTLRNRPRIELDMAEDIEERSTYAIAVAAQRGRSADLSYKEYSSEGIFINGVSANYPDVSTIDVEFGRFFTGSEDRTGAQVIILGSDVAKALFPFEDPIDKEIFVGSSRFRVIGVLAEMGKFLGTFSQDAQVIIPIKTFNKIFHGPWGMRRITVKVPEEHIEDAKEELRGIVRVLRGQKPEEKDNFAINQQKAFRQQYQGIKLAIGGTGLVITALSLLVGGIGIANIMFVSVKERTREIGVRKALGATRGKILGQFLIESMLITASGGIVGLLVSTLASLAINKFLFPASMSFGVAFMAIALSATVGLIAGLAPARKGSLLDPIEALRYE
ncbi:MAG: ABC transporter permease [Candidatus Marinimicrobia bacterium]|nr:ABC transporter permease [Candidatus Neomarinimicrobiota bacterium]MCF7850617.1 ABC transporter permease [Candidatus Neomarinimicrobiota bacterium]MCF7903649.1 ABC transporter permease [Candidatus Neomarinimicrobiota bacterium]